MGARSDSYPATPARRAAIGLLAAAALALAGADGAGAQTGGSAAVPILNDPASPTSIEFEGETAAPRPIRGVPAVPQHPYMAPNGRSNLHNDAYMTDFYRVSGPLGDGGTTSTLFFRECASVAFDSKGRIVTICVGLDRPVLAMLDPHTLDTLAAMPLPVRNTGTGNPFNDFTGGGYFYLDHRDRAVLATTDHHIYVVGQTPEPGFELQADYDISSAMPDSDGIVSALPDWRNLLWFVTRSGIVGTLDFKTGAVHRRKLAGEGISNSFAVDETGGVFIVSDRRLYRFDRGRGGAPAISWSRGYGTTGQTKPGQSDSGSGTTPTLMGRHLVAIADNADPMNVVVHRRARRIRPVGAAARRILAKVRSKKARRKLRRRWKQRRRLVCVQAALPKGRGATDQSLIATHRSIITENNYGYAGAGAITDTGTVTEPGLTRIDLRPGWRGCRVVWRSTERAPSVVPKLSLANGLVYTYTRPPDGREGWYLTTLDFRTGETIYRRLAGTGFGFNNNYAPVTLGPDGTAYVGVLGGLVAFTP